MNRLQATRGPEYAGMARTADDDTDIVRVVNDSASTTRARLVYDEQGWCLELTFNGHTTVPVGVGDWVVRMVNHADDDEWLIIGSAAMSGYRVLPLASNVDTTASNDDRWLTAADRQEALHIETLLTTLKLSRGARSLNFEGPCRHDTSR